MCVNDRVALLITLPVTCMIVQWQNENVKLSKMRVNLTRLDLT